MNGEVKNSRRFPRIRSERSIRVSRLDPEGLMGLSSTRVLGLGGCMFYHPESLGAGTLVGLEIDAGTDGCVVTTARVVYEFFRGGDGYEVGVEFLDLGPRESELLERLLASGG